MNFKKELDEKVTKVNEIILKYIPTPWGHQKNLISAMEYSMTAGGKRLRPLIMGETYRMFGGQDSVIEYFMAAMEMIHTHSLIHDDLPAIDNDQYRRGKKTTHVVYGEAMGILAGDALLNLAYETAISSFGAAPDNPNIPRALMVLSEKTGYRGMLGGQTVDVEAEDTQISKEQLDFIYRLKTSALIEASLMIGGILAGATNDQVATLEKIGTDIGLAFQIEDDILDVTSTMEMLGKPIHSDEKNKKTTYITFKELDAARKDVEIISNRGLETFKGLKLDAPFFEELICWLVKRQY